MSAGPDRHAQKAARKTCAVCDSRLSAYNSNPTCWAHTLELPWMGPNTKPKQGR